MNLIKLFVCVLLQHLFRTEQNYFSWIRLQQTVIPLTKTCVLQVVLHQVWRKKMSVYTSNQTNITECPITTDQDAEFLIGFRFWFGVVSCCVAITGNLQSFMNLCLFTITAQIAFENCWFLMLSVWVVFARYHLCLNANDDMKNIPYRFFYPPQLHKS